MNLSIHILSSPCQNKGKELVDSQSQPEVRYSSHTSATDKIDNQQGICPSTDRLFQYTGYGYNFFVKQNYTGVKQ